MQLYYIAMIDSVLLNGWLEVADVSFPLAIGNIELLENLSNKYYTQMESWL